ncbi:MAG: helix-turn-helix domain-containing protein [Chitinophagaceae bacterium]|nr:helix-turn-helix domain-containing protein [Chitinophagaceae bacterium]
MTTTIEVLTKADLIQFKKDLIEEINKLFLTKTTYQDSEYFKSKEAKRILKCSDSTLQFYRQSGRLPHKKVGGVYYYTQADINQLLNS